MTRARRRPHSAGGRVAGAAGEGVRPAVDGGAEARDAGLYHLVIDSTALALDACVELIALASAARSDRLG